MDYIGSAIQSKDALDYGYLSRGKTNALTNALKKRDCGSIFGHYVIL